jgi:hypothetical protein
MDDSELVKIVERTARRDSLDGQGRIVLCDFRVEIQDPQLTAEHVLTVWRKFNPYLPIRQASPNVLIIAFDVRSSPRERYFQENNQK